MKDTLGIYYYPNPSNRSTRMYVRRGANQIEFRMWNRDEPIMWEKHEWIPLDVVKNAAEQFPNKGLDPMLLYDINVAQALLDEEDRNSK